MDEQISEEKTNEQTQTEEAKEEQTPGQSTQEASHLIEAARTAAKELTQANAELKQLLNRQESLKVEQTLGGKTDAGMVPKQESEDEKVSRETKKFLEGTGFEDAID